MTAAEPLGETAGPERWFAAPARPFSDSMPPAEPTLAALGNPFLRYFLATRPPFLSVTLVGCLLGLATAAFSGVALNPSTGFVAAFFALVAHAAVNVLNDYYDARNGTDAINTERIFPFTGGSRFIQNGVLAEHEVLGFGIALVAAVVVAGLWLTSVTAPGLVWIGVGGLLIGWAYSAPPLKLNSRGFGELCVAAGFTLVVVGTDFVQRGGYAWLPVLAGLPYALLVTNILYVNQFPDYRADRAAGKHHLVVRLGLQRARWGYVLIGLAAYGWLVGLVSASVLPPVALFALVPFVLSARATVSLLRDAERPAKLLPAIKASIAAANLHGLLLAVVLLVTGNS